MWMVLKIAVNPVGREREAPPELGLAAMELPGFVIVWCYPASDSRLLVMMGIGRGPG